MSVRPVDVDPAIRSAPAARPRSPEEILALRALPYERYLLTPWWTTRRNDALRSAGYRCERCASKRQLEVHHVSYERLGCERNDDLEVVCHGCHKGEHYNRVQTLVGIYTRILSEVLSERRLMELTDVVEEAKTRCRTYGVPYRHDEFHAAVSQVLPRVPFRPSNGKAELFHVGQPSEPLTRAEAAGIVAKLQVTGLIHHMPEVRPLTMRQFEKRRALDIVAQVILEQVKRCEEAESKPSKPDVTNPEGEK